MKVRICAVSSWNLDKCVIIEVNSIDEAIKRVQTDKTLVQSLIDNTYSWIDDNEEDIYSFIILTSPSQDYDIKLIIYDFYYE